MDEAAQHKPHGGGNLASGETGIRPADEDKRGCENRRASRREADQKGQSRQGVGRVIRYDGTGRVVRVKSSGYIARRIGENGVCVGHL